MGIPDVIERWHRVVQHGDLAALDDLLADDVVFHSPVVHTPQKGKAVTKLYLSAAFGVFSAGQKKDAGSGASEPGLDTERSQFRYVREIVGERDALFEFVTEIDGIVINGIDLIQWNDDGQISDFKVMVRPLKAINLLHKLMAGMLEDLQKR